MIASRKNSDFGSFGIDLSFHDLISECIALKGKRFYHYGAVRAARAPA